ncbi:hypothetical protein [Halovivax cerinus]|uniref:DUF8108 domain-containing protein n=1 Tax=Halovivax cerinus TaxID=1487865 RepID=A0ABD5NJV2_9EURY|nr:hypothetical protein [Halovivax cerinus]
MSRPVDLLYRFRVASFAVLRVVIVIGFLLGLLLGPALLFGSGPAILAGILLFLIALIALAGARPLSLYPAHVFGMKHRVDYDTFDGPRKHCVECGDTATKGLRRRYARQVVLFGVPFHTLEWGINDYCLDCSAPSATDPDSSTGWVRRQDESAARELDRALE